MMAIDTLNKKSIDLFLARLRVELYSAAQLLKDDDLQEFKKLINEIHVVLDITDP